MTTLSSSAVLRASVRRELESVALWERFDERERLRWIRQELENYFTRWFEFAKSDDIPLPALLADDLFARVVATSDVLGEELAAHAHPARAEWDRWSAGVANLQASGDRGALPELSAALEKLGSAMKRNAH